MNVDWNVVIAGFLGILCGFIAGVRYVKMRVISKFEEFKQEMFLKEQRTERFRRAHKFASCPVCGCNGERLRVNDSYDPDVVCIECLMCGTTETKVL